MEIKTVAGPTEPLVMCEDDTCSNQKSLVTIKFENLRLDDKVKTVSEIRCRMPDAETINSVDLQSAIKELQLLTECLAASPSLLKEAIDLIQNPTDEKAKLLFSELRSNESKADEQHRAIWILIPIIIGGLLIPGEAH
ncbi:hypothetical protein ACOW3S_001737 [Vibrio fluvialis]|uniref:hypothetical protein n=1 Tax=Vibrio fluvialis TaxID=676 RepID=UPI001C9BF4BF|nr:hypothetical protein [Vibrio fluvialis]MBY7955541.1 hypothetical protein [Vibrio fluvialis]MBY8211697.1 hypothetical protein [Vibrio fluvialis]MCG6350428.1 hypothetical protein [Vibrio fluvialis]